MDIKKGRFYYTNYPIVETGRVSGPSREARPRQLENPIRFALGEYRAAAEMSGNYFHPRSATL